MFLEDIWKDIPNIKVIEVTSILDYDKVKEALEAEKDTILLCGHGTEEGLLCPNLNYYIIDGWDINLLKDKTVHCIWCHGVDFIFNNKLSGFGTGMFISDKDEAIMYHMYDNIEIIPEANAVFANRINNLLKANINYIQWSDLLLCNLSKQEYSTDFIRFNYSRLKSLKSLMSYQSPDESYNINDEFNRLIPVIEGYRKKRDEEIEKRVDYFISIGIRAIHSDSGYVNDDLNIIRMVYPLYQSVISVGSKIVLYKNLFNDYRIVEVTKMFTLYGDRFYYFKPFKHKKVKKTTIEKLKIRWKVFKYKLKKLRK